MTTSAKPAAFLPLAKLPRTPASDLKKLGWRGIMNALRSKGRLLVTNHDEPEAVVIPVAEYDALMQLVEQSESQTESALAGLRRSFDERLSSEIVTVARRRIVCPQHVLSRRRRRRPQPYPQLRSHE